MDATTISLLTEARPAFFVQGEPVEPLQAAALPQVQRYALAGLLPVQVRLRAARPVRAAEVAGYSAGELSTENMGGLVGVGILLVGLAAAWAVWK